MRPIPANTLIPPKAPSLPVGPVEYDQRYTDQLNNVLRIYFNELDNIVGLLAGTGTGGGAYLRFPYGAFHDTTTQTAAAINTAYAVTFNTTDLSNGVSIGSPTSRITVTYSGIYNFQFSLQLDKSSGSTGHTYIWAAINGTEVAESASEVAVQGTAAETIAAWNFLLRMNAGDYFQLMWSTTDLNMQIKAVGASSPVPAIPSVILTTTFVSALPA